MVVIDTRGAVAVFATLSPSFIIAVADGDDRHGRRWSVTDGYGLLAAAASHAAAVTATGVLLTAVCLLTGLSRMPNCMRAVTTTIAAAAVVTLMAAVGQCVMAGGVRCMVT